MYLVGIDMICGILKLDLWKPKHIDISHNILEGQFVTFFFVAATTCTVTRLRDNFQFNTHFQRYIGLGENDF